MKNMRKGFTLIELLIVVVIIGILAAIAIPKFANTKSKAYIAAMKSDLRNLVTAEESYFADSAEYATDTTKGMKFKPSTGVGMPTIAIVRGCVARDEHAQPADELHAAASASTRRTRSSRRRATASRPVSKHDVEPPLMEGTNGASDLVRCAVRPFRTGALVV